MAFEINGKTSNLTPCRGRTLELGCYVIEIDLLKETKFNFLWLLLFIIPLGFAGFYMKDKFPEKEAQESNFDPVVVSHANAYGLMQVLPSTGRGLARKLVFVTAQSAALLWTGVVVFLLDRFNRVTALAWCMGLAAAGYLGMGFVNDPLARIDLRG